jgi:aryl-alcohol dehydrogenase-like predicted oxidoreductase
VWTFDCYLDTDANILGQFHKKMAQPIKTLSIPKENIRASVGQSIKRLATTPDLFLIHNPFVPAPDQLADARKVFEQLKDEGVLKCKPSSLPS